MTFDFSKIGIQKADGSDSPSILPPSSLDHSQMALAEILESLGTKRIVWIDDAFGNTPEALSTMLFKKVEMTRSCGFPELSEALDLLEIEESLAQTKLTEIIVSLSEERRSEIRKIFYDREKNDPQFQTGELSQTSVEIVCQKLNISEDDRWTFDGVDQKVTSLCLSNDDEVAYIIDLNETGGSSTRGLDVLQNLWHNKSRGTAFLLTHEAKSNTEGELETTLRIKLLGQDQNSFGIPVCVVAKERLFDDTGSDNKLDIGLQLALKRAGLRRSVYEVMTSARNSVAKAFDDAASQLFLVTPEQLEANVFERAYIEGVTELHVIERAVTASLGQHIREFFVQNPAVKVSTRRLRLLRNQLIELPSVTPSPQLAAFRAAEVWESGELINEALTPITCGDVFEIDNSEISTKDSKKRFILLAQPCDITIRPKTKRRDQNAAFLVPLRNRSGGGADNEKMPYLPFKLNGEQWACDYRNGTLVNVSILDLASFRQDGKVRVDLGHHLSDELLAGQKSVYKSRTSYADKILNASDAAPLMAEELYHPSLQLTFKYDDDFKAISRPSLEQASTPIIVMGTRVAPTVRRLTWKVRRCGRVRMPYAGGLLSSYLATMSRQAFDLDYMAERETSGEKQQ